MGETYSNLLCHVVFSTRQRLPSLTPEIQARLFPYIGGILAEYRGVLIEGGGVQDHVHLLVSLKPQTAVSDIVRHIKSSSSRWINQTFDLGYKFAWQSGYGVFSVSQSNAQQVARYIRNQPQHHRNLSSRGEWERLLQRHCLHSTANSPRRGDSS